MNLMPHPQVLFGHDVGRMVLADAIDDTSGHILQDFIAAGFREVEWRYGFEEWQNTKLWREMGGVCPVCFALDGQRFKIKWLMENQTHNAPKYTMSHVNCQCKLYRIDRANERLDFGEEVDIPTSQIPEELMEGPITLDQVDPGMRDDLGLPKQTNDWTDHYWIHVPERNEYIPWSMFDGEISDQTWFMDPITGEYLSFDSMLDRIGRA